MNEPDHSVLAEGFGVRTGPLIEAVGQQAEHVAGGQIEQIAYLKQVAFHDAQGHVSGRQHIRPSRGMVIVQQRPLAGRNVRELMAAQVQGAEERGDESVVGQVLGQQVVDVGGDARQVVAEPGRGFHEGPKLRNAHGRGDAVACGVGQKDAEPVAPGIEEVIAVPAGLVGRLVPARDGVTGKGRVLARQ